MLHHKAVGALHNVFKGLLECLVHVGDLVSPITWEKENGVHV